MGGECAAGSTRDDARLSTGREVGDPAPEHGLARRALHLIAPDLALRDAHALRDPVLDAADAIHPLRSLLALRAGRSGGPRRARIALVAGRALRTGRPALTRQRPERAG